MERFIESLKPYIYTFCLRKIIKKRINLGFLSSSKLLYPFLILAKQFVLLVIFMCETHHSNISDKFINVVLIYTISNNCKITIKFH